MYSINKTYFFIVKGLLLNVGGVGLKLVELCQ